MRKPAPSKVYCDAWPSLGPMHPIVLPSQIKSCDRRSYRIHVASPRPCALGALGRQAIHSAPALKSICESEAALELKAPALLALARIDAASCNPIIEAYEGQPSILLQASGAYARHLIGHSQPAFQKLLSLLDDLDTDEVIVETIADMGNITRHGCIKLRKTRTHVDASAWPAFI